jgi:hypothetical protein
MHTPSCGTRGVQCQCDSLFSPNKDLIRPGQIADTYNMKHVPSDVGVAILFGIVYFLSEVTLSTTS